MIKAGIKFSDSSVHFGIRQMKEGEKGEVGKFGKMTEEVRVNNKFGIFRQKHVYLFFGT